VQDGTYKPLGRPLFIYVKADALQRPEAKAFVEYYVANNAEIAEKALFIPLNAQQEENLKVKLEKLKGSA
jgi:phosphate transport system substrate-binding protein